MHIEADFSGEIDTEIVYEQIGIGCDFQICFRGNGGEINIQLSTDQFQDLMDKLTVWGFEPSDDAKKELEKIKNE